MKNQNFVFLIILFFLMFTILVSCGKQKTERSGTIEEKGGILDFLSFMIGIPAGIITSLIAWWILFHAIRPKLGFSQAISKIPTKENKSGFKYRIKIENYGLRNIIDVKLIAKLGIKGLRPEFPETRAIIYIPIDYKGEFPRIKPVKRGGLRHLISFNINELDFTKSIYPEKIRKKHKSETILLEDIFELGCESELEIIGYGHDNFSGARKLFESMPYDLTDIIEGPFEKGGM